VPEITNLEQARAQRQREATTAPTWCEQLAPSGSGYLGDERNVLIAMRTAPELQGLTRFNEFALNVELLRAPPWRDVVPGTPWTEADDTQCTAWLQAAGLKVRGSSTVAACIAVAARDTSYHPVREYLEALTWGREPRLQIWLAEYLNAQGDPGYLSAIGLRYLVSAVARILAPGYQASLEHRLDEYGQYVVARLRARDLHVSVPERGQL
jgi:putative DNA primase/helicase